MKTFIPANVRCSPLHNQVPAVPLTFALHNPETFELGSRHYLIDLAYLLTQRGGTLQSAMAHHNSCLVSPLPLENKNLQGRPTVPPLLYLPGRQHSLTAVGRAVLHLQQAQPRPSGRLPMCDRSAAAPSLPGYHGQSQAATGAVNTRTGNTTYVSKPSPALAEDFRRGATACLIKVTLQPFSVYLATAVKLLQEQLCMLL